MPKRIQRRRTRGWRMPPNAVYVGRPTIWGSPFKPALGPKLCVRLYRLMLRGRWRDLQELLPISAVEEFQLAILRVGIRKRLPELRGKDLACWCPLDQPCHVDVLLKLANRDADMRPAKNYRPFAVDGSDFTSPQCETCRFDRYFEHADQDRCTVDGQGLTHTSGVCDWYEAHPTDEQAGPEATDEQGTATG